MICEKCGYNNEKDSNFCRQCGSSIVIPGPEPKKTKTFVADTKRRTDEDMLCFGEEERTGSGGMILGIIFICVAIIMAIAMLGIFEDIGYAFGTFFGEFGQTMGRIGSDIGNFFSNWGTNFGTSVESFFGGIEWWDLIQPLIVIFFLLMGVILIYKDYKRRG
jgi:hypothetical protein